MYTYINDALHVDRRPHNGDDDRANGATRCKHDRVDSVLIEIYVFCTLIWDYLGSIRDSSCLIEEERRVIADTNRDVVAFHICNVWSHEASKVLPPPSSPSTH